MGEFQALDEYLERSLGKAKKGVDGIRESLDEQDALVDGFRGTAAYNRETREQMLDGFREVTSPYADKIAARRSYGQSRSDGLTGGERPTEQEHQGVPPVPAPRDTNYVMEGILGVGGALLVAGIGLAALRYIQRHATEEPTITVGPTDE